MIAQVHQRALHLDHGESVALAVGKELSPQVGYLFWNRDSARGDLKECA